GTSLFQTEHTMHTKMKTFRLLTHGWDSVHCHVVEDIVGQGSFGMVAKCRNTETNNSVAVKVIRGTEDFVDSAISEIAALKRLRCLDSDTCNIVQWNGFFFDKENICIAFELLDQSLRYYLQEEKSWGLSVGELRPILHQVATALSHLHSIGVVHMDLKPDNIMIVDRHQHPLKVKLIDFGLAHPVSALKQGDSMGTLWYFAPEMLLGVPFDESIDMWALGLIMAELAMGCTLYPGEVEYDVLRFIVETQGQPPDDVLDRGMYTEAYFYAQEDNIEHRNDQKLFISLIKSMLTLDVSDRIKAREVLEHQFFAPSHRQDQGRDPNPHQPSIGLPSLPTSSQLPIGLASLPTSHPFLPPEGSMVATVISTAATQKHLLLFLCGVVCSPRVCVGFPRVLRFPPTAP
uniref:Protein kinase domain-containing protein n=1 Tax=Stegastes partitus TaxID=144197 RepID=A0A3B5AYG4_9TELE